MELAPGPELAPLSFIPLIKLLIYEVNWYFKTFYTLIYQSRIWILIYPNVPYYPTLELVQLVDLDPV